MEKSRFSFLKVISLILIITLLSACSTRLDKSDGPISQSPDYLGEISDGDSSINPELDKGDSEESGSMLEGEKIISTYFLTLETMDFENTRKDLEALMKKHKSFVENSNIGFRGFEHSKNYRYGDFSIRIPKENVEKFKTEINQIGNITDESTNKNDVTKYYKDNESRLKLVTAKEKRLLELLEKAVKVEDIIAVESELTNTIYEKEMLEKSLQSIDERIDYTTLNLNIIEVRNFSNTDKANSSLLIRLKNAFKDSFFAFKLAIENFIVWLVFALPYIIVLVPLIIVTIFLVKRFKRKS